MTQAFIIAELSGEHCGQPLKMQRLINAAHLGGADAVKLQCFTPEQMAEPGTIVEAGPWAGRELLDLYRETHTTRAMIEQAFKYCQHQDVMIFASVFHKDDVDFLETLKCPIYKISSFEALDLPLIEHAATTGKPLIISTGMCTWQEVDNAVKAARAGGCADLTLLKCTSSYPAALDDCNMATLTPMRFDSAWDVDVGLSDHTKGSIAAVMAIALGATVIEKHLTLDHLNGGPDASFALDPEELRLFVRDIRDAELAMGREQYGPTPSEHASLQFRRKQGGKRGQ